MNHKITNIIWKYNFELKAHATYISKVQFKNQFLCEENEWDFYFRKLLRSIAIVVECVQCSTGDLLNLKWANRCFVEKWQRKRGKPPSKRNLSFIMHVSLPESTVLRLYGKGAKTLKQCSIPGGFRVTECMFRLIFHYGTFIFVIYYYASFNPCSELQILWNRTKYLWMWHAICAHLRIERLSASNIFLFG